MIVVVSIQTVVRIIALNRKHYLHMMVMMMMMMGWTCYEFQPRSLLFCILSSSCSSSCTSLCSSFFSFTSCSSCSSAPPHACSSTPHACSSYMLLAFAPCAPQHSPDHESCLMLLVCSPTHAPSSCAHHDSPHACSYYVLVYAHACSSLILMHVPPDANASSTCCSSCMLMLPMLPMLLMLHKCSSCFFACSSWISSLKLMQTPNSLCTSCIYGPHAPAWCSGCGSLCFVLLMNAPCHCHACSSWLMHCIMLSCLMPSCSTSSSSSSLHDCHGSSFIF